MIRTKKKFIELTRMMNVFSIGLVLVSGLAIGKYIFFELKDNKFYEVSDTRITIPKPEAGKGLPPNIFFIIMDEYARQDILQEIYDYDNSEFLDSFAQKGFFVANQATSNYNQTALSISATMNMQYLDEFVKKVGSTSGSRTKLIKSIENSAVFRLLREQGYKIIEFGSPYVTNPDILISPGWHLNRFHNEILNMTPFPFVRTSLVKLALLDQIESHRENILATLDNLANTDYKEGPFIAFAYLEVPHPPFVFGANGEKVSYESILNDHDGNWLITPGRITYSDYLKGYRDQVKFANKKINIVIDKILANSEQPPVIIIMGDHGPRSLLVWEDGKETFVKESMSIFNAYYFPGENNGLYNSISPVNTFRLVFNTYFGANLDILEDKNYYSTARYLYEFEDVTERVKAPEPGRIHYLMGTKLGVDGKVDEAIRRLKKSVQENPNHKRAQNNLGIAFAKKGDLENAKIHFSKALMIDPSFSGAIQNMERLNNILK